MPVRLRVRYVLLNTGISIDFDRFPTLGLDLKNSPFPKFLRDEKRGI
jgi:hypothetical protein